MAFPAGGHGPLMPPRVTGQAHVLHPRSSPNTVVTWKDVATHT